MANPTFGQWPPSAGDSDAGGATPLCVAQFRLGAGTEALTSQLGSEVFGGVTVNGPGDYLLLIDTPFQSVLTDFTALFLSSAVGGFAPRVVMLNPDLPSGNIACTIVDEDGAPATVSLLWVTLYYDTEAPPT